MARMLKIFVILMVVTGLLVAAYAWQQNRNEDDGGNELVEVSRGAITEKAVAIGQIEPRLKYQVKSKIPGLVRRVRVEVGDRVEAGEALFDIAPDPTPSELVEAERRMDAAGAAFRRAEAEWDRVQTLAAQGITPRSEQDVRREAYEQARIERNSARANLELVREGRAASGGRTIESVIRAPAAGIVLARHVDPGDPVVPLTTFQEGTELATIADMGDLIFEGTVDEIDVGKLSVGVPARLDIGALPGVAVTGRLSRIAPQATEEEGARLFDVEIELDPDQDVELRAGYSATANLIIREKEDVLVIPERLVLFEDGGAKTFVEVPGGTPEAEPKKVAVETGLSDGLQIEILSGVEEGDQVVQRPPRDVL